MRFLPFETIVIETSLTKEETIMNLTDNVESKNTLMFFNKSEYRYFEGHLKGDEFEIERIIRYRNSFLPIIKGRIETVGNGARVTIDMKLSAVVMVFMLIWFCLVGLVLIIGIVNFEDSNEKVLFPLGVPVGMLVSGYVLTMGGYLFESYRAKTILTDIVKGQIINNAR